jgi:hypothetical protein
MTGAGREPSYPPGAAFPGGAVCCSHRFCHYPAVAVMGGGPMRDAFMVLPEDLLAAGVRSRKRHRWRFRERFGALRGVLRVKNLDSSGGTRDSNPVGDVTHMRGPERIRRRVASANAAPRQGATGEGGRTGDRGASHSDGGGRRMPWWGRRATKGCLPARAMRTVTPDEDHPDIRRRR